ncbi:MAG: Allergen V5/Tpx family protein [Acidimicrobiales bacterium]|nr:Allergen V5/Tpx family protein [Acidimicrobiales bacterium]
MNRSEALAADHTEPSHGARDRPRRRRLVTVAFLAASALVLSACLNAEQQTGLNALNADRRAAGAPALKTQQDAQAKAQAWANKLARDNKLSHSVLTDGIHVKYCNLGENVGLASSIPAAEAGFMRSTIHKGNIVNRAWNGVGIGVAHNGARVFVVQFFIKTC